jgi:hypothetical protein
MFIACIVGLILSSSPTQKVAPIDARLARDSVTPTQVVQSWAYTGDLYHRYTGSNLSTRIGSRQGKVAALSEAEARLKAEDIERRSWVSENPLLTGTVYLKISSIGRTPTSVPRKPAAPSVRDVAKVVPLTIEIAKSDERADVRRLIGGDASCLVAKLPGASTIDRVTVSANDNNHKHSAALWIYVDGEPIRQLTERNVKRNGGVIVWDFPANIRGSVVSLVSREEGWSSDRGGSAHKTQVDWVSIQFKSEPLPVAPEPQHLSPAVIIPTRESQSLTLPCKIADARFIAVFADDDLDQDQRGAIQVWVRGKPLGKLQRVSRAGSWHRFDARSVNSGDLLEVRAFHEDGAENRENIRVHHVAVLP